uniref:Toll-like receptor 3 n=1 Tax=Ictalurus punctatus TaxID=7998 RepID=Q00L02_ICTPU|nr:Toll-like receptor 3 [Ictalurus punctatus]ABD93873.1 Toll-like receptor 3 [Ictalurus punctatus]
MAIWNTTLPLLFLCTWVLVPSRAYRSECRVELRKADCSHMNLNTIPQDLPEDISVLDVSHNRLVELKPSSLTRYRSLEHIDASYNSLKAVPAGLCQATPELWWLTLRHNEVHLLQDRDLRNCTRLTHLDLSDNRLRLTGEPFSGTENLAFLDVSRNKLTTARLGSRPQLPSLQTLVVAGNDIADLKKDDFYFLNESSLFRTLSLSSLPLKKVDRGCFKPIAGLQDLVLDGCKLNPSFMSRLCEELSDTSLRNLSIQFTQQVMLNNSTFKGLGKTNLTILDLSNNNMARITDGAFQWFPMLEYLSLEHNNLKHLTKGTFLGLKSLRKLNLQSALAKGHASPLPVIDDFSFQPLVKLEYLYMEKTSFREITENIFYGLPCLRELNLGWSSTGLKIVSNTTFASLNGSSLLQMLNLTGMGIKTLEPGAFSSLGNLEILVLSHNYINQQLTGEEFQGLHSIREIHLSFNQQMITLMSTSFIHVPTLRTLMLGHALSSNLEVEPSPFRLLVNLTLLDLSNNNIANIKNGLLDGLHHLSVLKLQHNNLARVWKNANPGGPVLILRDAQNLTVLELDYNGLDEIPMKAFQGLSKLKYISISGNLLNFLHDSIFDNLRSLRFLRLQKNLLTSVRRETFGVPLSNLTELFMDHNPFDCTCESILWFNKWLNTTNTSVPDRAKSYVCNTPSMYFNRSVLDFNPESCKDLVPFQALYVITSSLVLGLMVLAFLVHFQGWRIQFYWNILVNRTLDINDSRYKRVAECRYEYKAYVVHAQEDRLWVERSLLPLEDKDFRFFLEDRDAMPGSSRLETIVDNMRISRKILFVVTEALLNDPWCRQFKVHHALHQLMEENRDSLVLIFLEDVADYRLTQSLMLRKGMLKHRCMLQWPLQKERIPAFRQKLQLALASSNRVS